MIKDRQQGRCGLRLLLFLLELESVVISLLGGGGLPWQGCHGSRLSTKATLYKSLQMRIQLVIVKIPGLWVEGGVGTGLCFLLIWGKFVAWPLARCRVSVKFGHGSLFVEVW